MRKKVIIIGGGFAGLQLVKKLDSTHFDILLIDKLNHHQFQPLFYQVATSQLEPSSISFPLRNIIKKKKNVQVRLAEVLTIAHESKTVFTTIGNFSYDILVIAAGCTTNFFGNKNIALHSYTLKSTAEALAIRNHVLQVFEDALTATAEEREALLNIVIVGAGPTGVELSGAFAEIKTQILPKDFPDMDFSGLRILLIEGSKHTLNNMSDNSKQVSEQYLKNLGVEIISETFVKDYDGKYLTLSTGQIINTKTVIWAAGVIANSIKGLDSNSITFGNRIKVSRTNEVYGYKDIYAVGDIAYMETPLYPKGQPQVANVAINQANNLAKNLKALSLNKPTKEYEYKDLGSMATIGKHKAVVDIGKVKITGYFAWFIWMFLHLMLILSVKNKLIIFINWAWAYITRDTSLRLILRPEEKQ
jgi:NADH dehydrogenase